MILRLVREIYNPTNTISKLYINDVFFCNILEDVDRGLYFTQPLEEIEKLKVYGNTAIPKGVYEIAITYSERFKKYLPLLMNVPGFAGIRIHPGNTEADTLGCLLPGVSNGTKVLQSKVTFDKLFAKLKQAAKTEKIIIFIESTK
jgi:hypothetical protein